MREQGRVLVPRCSGGRHNARRWHIFQDVAFYIRRQVSAMSLVEVLVALVLLSMVILYLLRMTSNAVFQAKILQTKREMLSVAADISSTIEELMYSTYRDQDWDTILKDGLVLTRDTGGNFVISNAIISCSVTGNLLNTTCPTVVEFSPRLSDRFGYYVDVSANPPLYQYSVTIGCINGTSCDSNRIKPVRIIRILVKP